MKKIVIFHNIVSPYKTLLFNELNSLLNNRLEVVYFAEKFGCREWNINLSDIKYSYKILNKGNLDELSGTKLCGQIVKYLWSNRSKIDVIIAGEYVLIAYWVLWLYSIVFAKNFAAILESQEQDHSRNSIKEFVKKIFFMKCCLVIAAGEKHRKYAEKLGMPAKCVAVMHGVGGVDKKIYDQYLQKFCYEESKLDVCGKLQIPYKKYFIFVGRFSPEKNIFMLLHSYKKIVEKYGDEWGLLLVGNGLQLQQIRNFIVEQKLENIYIPGFIQQDILPLYYLASDVFILPSISEPWGLVVDEAIALGKPVLLSERCGCTPDIVQAGQNGILFNPMDEMSLYYAMEKVVTGSVDLKMYGKCSIEISKKYTSTVSAQIIAEALEKI